MNWHSASEFFAMGGYTLYVWGSFGVCALALMLEPLLVTHRRREIVATLRRKAQANKFDKEDHQ